MTRATLSPATAARLYSHLASKPGTQCVGFAMRYECHASEADYDAFLSIVEG